MNRQSRLALSVVLAFGYASTWLGCSSDTSSGTDAGSGSASSGSASSGTASSGTASSGSASSGTASSGTASSGTASSGTASSGTASSGTASSGTSSSGTSTTDAGEGGTTEGGTEGGTAEGGTEGGTLPTADSVRATCPTHGAASPAFTAQQFCVLFNATCTGSNVSNQSLTMESTCEPMYAGWTTAQQVCRSYHLCNATNSDAGNMTATLMTHCPHAQGVGLCP